MANAFDSGASIRTSYVEDVGTISSDSFNTTQVAMSPDPLEIPTHGEEVESEVYDVTEAIDNPTTPEVAPQEVGSMTDVATEGMTVSQDSSTVTPPTVGDATEGVTTPSFSTTGGEPTSAIDYATDSRFQAPSGDSATSEGGNGTSSSSVLAEDIHYELPSDMTIEIDGEQIDPMSLTEEDLEALIGQMDQQQYDELLKKIKAYYQQQLDYYGEMLGNTEELIKILEDGETLSMLHIFRIMQFDMDGFLAHFIETYLSDEVIAMDISEEYSHWTTDQRLNFLLDLLAKREYTGEDFDNLTTEQKLELVKNCDSIDAKLFLGQYQTYAGNKATIDQYLNNKFGEEYDIHSYDDYVKQMDALQTYKGQLEEAVKMTKNMMDSAYYDYLPYLKEYNDFEYTEAEFIELVLKTGSQELIDILTVAEVYPQFAKTYYYLYKTKGSREANEFLKKCKYEINNIRGQLWAKQFLSALFEKNGEGDEVLKAVANELGITVKGLVDGLDTFFMGGVYTIEALFTALGIMPENRTMSANEYKKMYILQALFSQEEKAALGLIEKDPITGEWKNTGASIIDFTKEYSGGALLKHSYQIAQGIGNMLPSIAIASVCPLAGSIAMGVSAGGNSYHNAMVEGHSLASSIMYGIFTGASESISEYILGGLPFLSNSKVHSLLSYLGAAGKEGFQEIFQGLMDLTYQYAYMGKELPKTEKEWLEVLNDLKWQGIYGAITAGILNSTSLVAVLRRNHAINSFMNKNNITHEQYENALKELRASNPDLAKVSEAQLRFEYAQEIMRRALIQQAAVENNISLRAAEVMLALGIDPKTAKFMVDHNYSLEKAKEVLKHPLEAEILDGNHPETKVKISDSQLEKYNIAMMPGTTLYYDQTTGEFYRKNIDGTTTPISKEIFQDTKWQSGNDRVVKIEKEGKTYWVDLITGMETPAVPEYDWEKVNQHLEGEIKPEKGTGQGLHKYDSFVTQLMNGTITIKVDGVEIVNPISCDIDSATGDLVIINSDGTEARIHQDANGLWNIGWAPTVQPKPNKPKRFKGSTLFPPTWTDADIQGIIETYRNNPDMFPTHIQGANNPRRGYISGAEYEFEYTNSAGETLVVVVQIENNEIKSVYPRKENYQTKPNTYH